MIELNEGLAGTPVVVVPGEQVRVSLAEAGGTGYRWQVGTACDGLLHLEREHKDQPGTKPGASVMRTWVYTAGSGGSCELRFELARSWEKTVTGRTVLFPVTVKKGS